MTVDWEMDAWRALGVTIDIATSEAASRVRLAAPRRALMARAAELRYDFARLDGFRRGMLATLAAVDASGDVATAMGLPLERKRAELLARAHAIRVECWHSPRGRPAVNDDADLNLAILAAAALRDGAPNRSAAIRLAMERLGTPFPTMSAQASFLRRIERYMDRYQGGIAKLLDRWERERADK